MPLVLSGFAMLPTGAVMIAFSPVSALISKRFGPRTTFVAGAAILFVANLGRALFAHPLGFTLG
ncbi:hypothetical protein [Rhodococcus koreensis]